MAARKKKAPATRQAPLFQDPAPVPAGALYAVDELAAQLATTIAELPTHAKVVALNRARAALHAVSPFQDEPVDLVLWIPDGEVERNFWNPNVVHRPELVALDHSMTKYGVTMPIVGSWIGAENARRVGINDGFHRSLIPQQNPALRARLHGYLPVAFIRGDMTEADRMSCTILMNAARGGQSGHAVEKELPIIQALEAQGWTPEQIAVGTVKSNEELVRIAQLAGGGAAANLAGHRYSKAWRF